MQVTYASRVLDLSMCLRNVSQFKKVPRHRSKLHHQGLARPCPCSGNFKDRNLQGRIERWFVTVQEYDPMITYIPRRWNTVADSLPGWNLVREK